MSSGPFHPGAARERRDARERGQSGEEDPLAAPDGQQQLDAARECCFHLTKGIKQLNIFKHNVARYPEYMERCHRSFASWVDRWGPLSFKVETQNFSLHKQPLLTEDTDLAYRFYKDGIRHLIFRPGLTVDELVELTLIAITNYELPENKGNDILQELWRAEFPHIEYVVMEGFQIDDMTDEQVEVEVDRIVGYLYDRLKSHSRDYLRFARLEAADLDLKLDHIDQVRGSVISGAPASEKIKAKIQEEIRIDRDERLLNKLSGAVFQVLEDAGIENREATNEIFVRLLDAMLLQEDFTAIASILSRFRALERDPRMAAELAELHAFFVAQMGAPERLERIGLILESSRPRNLADVTRYLTALNHSAIDPLLSALDGITVTEHRQLVVDALAVLGHDDPEPFLRKLETDRSITVRDMLQVLEKMELQHRFVVYGRVLHHPNLAVRLEALGVVGRNRTEQCRRLVSEALKDGQAQLRVQAAWLLPQYDPARAATELLTVVRGADFVGRSIEERLAFVGALGSTQREEALAFFKEQLGQKSILHRARLREQKLLAAAGLGACPSIAAYKLLQAEAGNAEHDAEIKTALMRSMGQVKKHIFGDA